MPHSRAMHTTHTCLEKNKSTKCNPSHAILAINENMSIFEPFLFLVFKRYTNFRVGEDSIFYPSSNWATNYYK